MHRRLLAAVASALCVLILFTGFYLGREHLQRLPKLYQPAESVESAPPEIATPSLATPSLATATVSSASPLSPSDGADQIADGETLFVIYDPFRKRIVLTCDVSQGLSSMPRTYHYT
jgi:hypothetical protein